MIVGAIIQATCATIKHLKCAAVERSVHQIHKLYAQNITTLNVKCPPVSYQFVIRGFSKFDPVLQRRVQLAKCSFAYLLWFPRTYAPELGTLSHA